MRARENVSRRMRSDRLANHSATVTAYTAISALIWMSPPLGWLVCMCLVWISASGDWYFGIDSSYCWLLQDPMSRHATTCGLSGACDVQPLKHFVFRHCTNFRMKACVWSRMSCPAIWQLSREKPMEARKIWSRASKRWKATSIRNSRGDRMGFLPKAFELF